MADCGIGLRLGETSCCEPLDPVEAAKMELMESTGCQVIGWKSHGWGLLDRGGVSQCWDLAM